MHDNKHNELYYLPQGYFEQLKIINNLLFTPREIDIISCIANMRGSSKIASILGISVRTAETHIANVKKKIDNGSREVVIDFIEKSDKFFIIRQHYQNLLTQADFRKKLKSISKLTVKAPVCYFFDFNGKDPESIITVIPNHLKMAGIKLIISTKNDIINPKQGEHLIYIITNKSKNNLTILKALEQASVSPNHFTFLLTEQLDSDFLNKHSEIKYIDFTKENYYLTIFELLKKLVPEVNFSKIISQLNYPPIADPKNYTISQNEKTVFFKSKIQKIWLKIILLVLLTMLTVFGYNNMTAKPTEKLPIISYIPEILTGYENFIGREKELQQITDILAKDNIIIITGCAGMGKSSLAIEYGKRHKSNQIIRYVHADAKTKIDQQYQELAQELNINIDQPSSNLVMQLVNNKLNNLTTKILFIFDNVDQYDDVKDYLANLPMNIKVIITSRQPILIANKPHITLEEFNHLEAEQYLKNSLQNVHLSEASLNKLLQDTGTLPYDLKCVAAYLIDNPFIDSMQAINKLGNKIQDKLFQEFAINPDPIRQQAWQILQYAANLDPDFINIEIINELFSQDNILLSAALQKLKSLSLISIINDQQHQSGFRIHRKLQQNVLNSAKRHVEYAINQQKLTEHLLRVLDQLFPEVISNTNDHWQIAGKLQPHVTKLLYSKTKCITKTSKVNQANLFYKLAIYHTIVNINYPKALEYAKTALEKLHILDKANNRELANAHNVIATIYGKLGDVPEGFKHSITGLKIRQQLYAGKDHPDIADSLYTLGEAYRRKGEPQQGIEYLEMALEMNKRLYRLYSGEHYQVARTLRSIGCGYVDLGDFKKSLEYLKASLNILNKLHPIVYDKIADVQTNLANSYSQLGNHVKALKYAKSSVELMKKHYPEGHPVSIYSLNDFGDILIRSNTNTKEGLRVLHQALDLIQKFNMNKHFTAAFVLSDLGWGYFKNEDYKTAFKYSEQALTLRKEMYGHAKNHHEIAESLYNLALINLALGNKNTGLQLCKDAVAMYSALSLEHLPEPLTLKQKIKELNSA